ncbi:Cytosolic phospholipase A2 gamma [Labeo rohita]|uniref:Cytosolic phospholipase A2 gamma n=1 Tax=Labeo rohita TaxID=84645 RepID=A0ABQ8L4R8_LABRO|nr:Cytosolic phospholipase A2 gamma [Labeo rohita]
MGTCISQESSTRVSVFSHSSSGVRIRHSLNKDEEEFVVKRRKTVLKSLQKLKIYSKKNAVPNIALLGSGGGQRAMVSLLECLVQLDKAGLLDCILYLSGVSGSTWCMASLYQVPDWSTKLGTVKKKIVSRLNGPGVSWREALAKLKKYYYGKDLFSLTDLWAVWTVTKYIDERTLTSQRRKHRKDPFPIYTVIDKQCKQRSEGDPWFEISPYEAGYSLTGAFVGTSSFGSRFYNGSKTKHQPEMDMLYLQAMCGSAIADERELPKLAWQGIRDFLFKVKSRIENGMIEGMEQGPNSPPAEKCSQVLIDLVDMNVSVLNGIDPFDLHESIRTNLNELTGGKSQPIFQMEKLNLADKEAAILRVTKYTLDICACLRFSYNFWPLDKTVPRALRESQTRDYIDAGLFLNSPYFSVLREERDIDLIISLDFSEGDPFLTVKEAAKTCKKLKIPFPEVYIPSQDVKKPKDFYVFKGKNVPTVIHIPLFNVVMLGHGGTNIRRPNLVTALRRSDEVPNIALLGSGGGQRAMVGLLGSLVELDKAGLLDCILYLSGVSGSTWCMASLYQEPDWSTKLDTVKNKIIERLSGPGVSLTDKLEKLKKYYYGKTFFSLTDVWAVLFVTPYVKEIDEQTITEQRKHHKKDPFPIYTVIDKQCKQSKTGDPWFEINPYEAGYSLTGAFVDTCHFGSQFHEGSKKNDEALCGSALADEKDIMKSIWERIKGIFQERETVFEAMREDAWASICKCMAQWIWGRKYNFLHNMTDGAVPPALLQNETRDYEDAGLLNNSPYFSVLRKDRDIDLIISLDFNKLNQWRDDYRTFQASYSAEMITNLMEVAGKNITNNKNKLLEEIRMVVGRNQTFYDQPQ